MLFTGDAPELGSGQLVPVGYYSEFQFRPVPVPAGTFKFGSGAPLLFTGRYIL